MITIINNKQQKLYRNIPIIALVLSVTLYFIGIFVVKTQRPMLIKFDKPVVLDSDWYFSESGEIICDEKISLSGEEISISHKLPSYIPDGYFLTLWSFYTQFEVYIDGQKISKNGSEDKPRFGQETGGIYFFVPIPKGIHNEITLKLKSTWKKQNFSLKTVFYGTKNQIGVHILRKNYISSIIALILGIYIILLLLYLGVMNYYKMFDYSRLILALCGLTGVSIFYIINESNIIQFYSTNPSIRYLGSYFSVFFTPVFGCIFFREFFKRGKKFYTHLQIVYSFLLILSLILYSLNVVHVLYSVVIVYFGVLLIGYAVTYYGIKDYKETRDILYICAIIAVVILILGTTTSVVLYYIGLTTDNIIPFSYTYLAFISILFITVMRKTFREFSLVTTAGYYRELAFTDKVTSGNSSAYFDENLKSKNYLNYSFIIINLVRFKLINRIIGHKKSDEMLKGIYQTIEKIVKPEEMICSMGNARFAVMINSKQIKDIYKFCSTVEKDVKTYVEQKNKTVKVNFQFAACQNSKENNSMEKLIDCAAMAISSSKSQYIPEINCYIYNDECSNQLLKEKMYSDYLETALVNGEFQVYLQPKYFLKDGKIHSAEALIRWISPERGMIPPDEFIPSFEQDGKIELLDLYTFRKVCLIINKWLESGTEPPIISVNISKVAITQEGYFQSYMDIIKELKVPGKYLEFELTESIAYDNIGVLKSIINQIHAIDSKCSMDDFGKSYSNIGALGMLPFDIVKMDKCFFDTGFPQIEKRNQLVKGTIELLKNLELEIIAEGIEEKEQVEALESIGCDAIQGYYFAKPMDLESFNKLVEKNR